MISPAAPPSDQPPGRIAAIDAARGLAILAMVAYHLAWDLWYLGFTSGDLTTEPGWIAFQRTIVGSFLLLVGVGLVLGHGHGIRWRPFWRRFALIAAAAVATTIGTLIVFPDYFVYFGVLHAIALFSLLGLAFLRVPPALTALAGIAVIALPLLVPADAAMMQRPLSWIGFWPLPPPTTDIVPVFPWFGVTLLGIAATRRLAATPVLGAIARLRLDGIAGRALRWLGRWSLVVYLVHQPLLFGGLSLVAPRPVDEAAFVSSCEAGCSAGAAYCARYCLCTRDAIAGQNLWAEADRSPPTAPVAAIIGQCAASAAAP